LSVERSSVSSLEKIIPDAVGLWKMLSRQDPRDHESGLMVLHAKERLQNQGYRLYSGTEHKLKEEILTLWRMVPADEMLRFKIKETLKHLSENIRQHAGNWGMLCVKLFAHDTQLFLAVIDAGKGFYPETYGAAPRINLMSYQGQHRFMQRPDSPGVGKALGEVYDLSDELGIFSKGYVWKKSNPVVQKAAEASHLRGSLVFVTITVRDNHASSPIENVGLDEISELALRIEYDIPEADDDSSHTRLVVDWGSDYVPPSIIANIVKSYIVSSLDKINVTGPGLMNKVLQALYDTRKQLIERQILDNKLIMELPMIAEFMRDPDDFLDVLLIETAFVKSFCEYRRIVRYFWECLDDGGYFGHTDIGCWEITHTVFSYYKGLFLNETDLLKFIRWFAEEIRKDSSLTSRLNSRDKISGYIIENWFRHEVLDFLRSVVSEIEQYNSTAGNVLVKFEQDTIIPYFNTLFKKLCDISEGSDDLVLNIKVIQRYLREIRIKLAYVLKNIDKVIMPRPNLGSANLKEIVLSASVASVLIRLAEYAGHSLGFKENITLIMESIGRSINDWELHNENKLFHWETIRDEITGECPDSPYMFFRAVECRLIIGISDEKVRKILIPIIYKKCVVLDCDGVLWGGIVGEDGLEGIKIRPEHKEFQRSMKELSARGVILAINSKNYPENVLEVLEEHPEMILRRDDFSAIKANWQNKADNMQEIARELNIGIDSFVFVDDSVTEIQLIENVLPRVLAYRFPENMGDVPELIQDLNDMFSSRVLTEEAKLRKESYAAQKLREEKKAASESYEEYRRKNPVMVSWDKNKHPLSSLSRIAELTQTTNQFNFTLRRYSLDQMLLISLDDTQVLYTLSVADTYGNFGIAGTIILKMFSPERADVEVFCVSCRLLKEIAFKDSFKLFMAIILEDLKKQNVIFLRGRYIPGAKNKDIALFYDLIGNREGVDLPEGEISWLIDVKTVTIPLPFGVSVKDETSASPLHRGASPIGTKDVESFLAEGSIALVNVKKGPAIVIDSSLTVFLKEPFVNIGNIKGHLADAYGEHEMYLVIDEIAIKRIHDGQKIRGRGIGETIFVFLAAYLLYLGQLYEDVFELRIDRVRDIRLLKIMENIFLQEHIFVNNEPLKHFSGKMRLFRPGSTKLIQPVNIRVVVSAQSIISPHINMARSASSAIAGKQVSLADEPAAALSYYDPVALDILRHRLIESGLNEDIAHRAARTLVNPFQLIHTNPRVREFGWYIPTVQELRNDPHRVDLSGVGFLLRVYPQVFNRMMAREISFLRERMREMFRQQLSRYKLTLGVELIEALAKVVSGKDMKWYWGLCLERLRENGILSAEIVRSARNFKAQELVFSPTDVERIKQKKAQVEALDIEPGAVAKIIARGFSREALLLAADEHDISLGMAVDVIKRDRENFAARQKLALPRIDRMKAFVAQAFVKVGFEEMFASEVVNYWFDTTVAKKEREARLSNLKKNQYLTPAHASLMESLDSFGYYEFFEYFDASKAAVRAYDLYLAMVQEAACLSDAGQCLLLQRGVFKHALGAGQYLALLRDKRQELFYAVLKDDTVSVNALLSHRPDMAAIHEAKRAAARRQDRACEGILASADYDGYAYYFPNSRKAYESLRSIPVDQRILSELIVSDPFLVRACLEYGIAIPRSLKFSRRFPTQESALEAYRAIPPEEKEGRKKFYRLHPQLYHALTDVYGCGHMLPAPQVPNCGSIPLHGSHSSRESALRSGKIPGNRGKQSSGSEGFAFSQFSRVVQQNSREKEGSDILELWNLSAQGDLRSRDELIEYFLPRVIALVRSPAGADRLPRKLTYEEEFFLSDELGDARLSLLEIIHVNGYEPDSEDDLERYVISGVRKFFLTGKFGREREAKKNLSLSEPYYKKDRGQSVSDKGGSFVTFEDRLGRFEDPLERFMQMETFLIERVKSDIADMFLPEQHPDIDFSSVFSRQEKEALAEELREFLIRKNPFGKVFCSYEVSIMGSLGYVGLGRKGRSDLNLVVAVDDDEADPQLLYIAKRFQHIMGGQIECIEEGHYCLAIGKQDHTSAYFKEVFWEAPEFISLLMRHGVGCPARGYASVEFLAIPQSLGDVSVALQRLRFHVIQHISEMGVNGIRVVASDDPGGRSLQQKVYALTSTDSRGYEWFSYDYMYRFIQRQVNNVYRDILSASSPVKNKERIFRPYLDTLRNQSLSPMQDFQGAGAVWDDKSAFFITRWIARYIRKSDPDAFEGLRKRVEYCIANNKRGWGKERIRDARKVELQIFSRFCSHDPFTVTKLPAELQICYNAVIERSHTVVNFIQNDPVIQGYYKWIEPMRKRIREQPQHLYQNIDDAVSLSWILYMYAQADPGYVRQLILLYPVLCSDSLNSVD